MLQASILKLQGTPVQTGINTISSNDNVVESKRVSFTLISLDSSEERIDIFALFQSRITQGSTRIYVTLSSRRLT